MRILCFVAQRAEPLDGSEEAAHTAAVVAELSEVMRLALKVSNTVLLPRLKHKMHFSDSSRYLGLNACQK